MEIQNESKKKNQQESQHRKLVIKRHDPMSRMNKCLYKVNNINYRNFLFMNQEALKGSDKVFQPFLESVFNYKKGSLVELKQDCIKVNLQDRQLPSVPLKYIVDRFRSFGDYRFNQMANVLEKLQLIIQQVCQIMQKNSDYYSDEVLQNILQKYKGKAYMAYASTFRNKELTMKSLILSRQLVLLLGYNPEDLSIKFSRAHIVKNFEIINSYAYPDFVFNYVQLMYQFNQLILQKGFSPEVWSSIAQCDRYLLSQMYSFQKQKITVQFKLNLHNPCFGVYQISRIFGKVNQFGPKRMIRPSMQSQCSTIQDEIQLIKGEQKAISQIINVPKTQLLWNQNIRCGYRQKIVFDEQKGPQSSIKPDQD